MEKKNIFLWGWMIIIFFVGLNNIEAKSYNSFKVGDEISVILNDNLTEKFYVIEDKNDSVKAIYESNLGEKITLPEFILANNGICEFENSVVDTALKEKTVSWSNALDIKLPSANDIVGEFDYSSLEEYNNLINKTSIDGQINTVVHLENLSNVPFYAKKSKEGYDFFTSSLMMNEEGHCSFYVYGYGNALFPHFNIVTKTADGYIRPTITVSKDNVVNGVKADEVDKVQEDQLWNKFVVAFENTEIIKMLKESANVIVTSTNDSLKVVYEYSDNSYTTDFNYADGIVNYVPSNTDENKVIDTIWIANTIYALSDLKGYNAENASAWVLENKNVSLSIDGIEYQSKPFTLKEESQISNIVVSSEIYTIYKLDIRNGLKNFNYKSGEIIGITNPKTGVVLPIVSLLVLGIGAMSIFIVCRKKKINKI